MKRILHFIFIFLIISLSAQSNFEYDRVWGTYFGPAGSQLAGVYKVQNLLFDSQQKMYTRGNIFDNQQFPLSYYNQFVLGNGGPYTYQMNNQFELTINQNGIPTNYGYDFVGSSVVFGDLKSLAAIDNQDNKYYFIQSLANTFSATPGAWYPLDPQPGSSTKLYLAKYNSSGSLLWSTYLPNDGSYGQVKLDSSGNVYVNCEATVTSGLTTAGVFQENFIPVYDSAGNLVENGYLVKLDQNTGQRIWATYLPATIADMELQGGFIYTLHGDETDSNQTLMATAGAFQTTKSLSSVAKFNALDGTRIWSTYYGNNQNLYFLFNLEVNSTGIYLAGTDFNWPGNNYFGTPGSYRPAVSGGSDLFLSKFSLDGVRQWSTYYGGNGEDENDFDSNLALKGDQIFTSGVTYNSSNNIATPGSYQSSPLLSAGAVNNFYFSKFDSSGNLIWTSYYGGSTFNPSFNYLKCINIAVNGSSLYLYGNTNSDIGYSTEGAFQPNIITPQPSSQYCAGFFARFDLKQNMATHEENLSSDLQLFDNPNNGTFTISGSVLEKKACYIEVYDASGRKIYKKHLGKEKLQHFDLSDRMVNGNYLVSVNLKSGELIKVFKMTVRK